MREYFTILGKAGLFSGIKSDNLSAVLNCTGARVVHYKRRETILAAGDRPTQIGVVLRGAVHVLREDIDGNSVIVAAISAGGFFAEALCCANIAESPVSVVTDKDSSVMLLDCAKILNICPVSCEFHAQLIRNLLGIIAQKNIVLQNRLEIISKKTLRKKVLALLDTFASGKNSITLPFNREQLADFLCTDRTALSHELSRMKQDGIIDYHKNKFTLIADKF